MSTILDKETPAVATDNLYALAPEQVDFIRRAFAAVPIQGNRQQVAIVLAAMDEIEAALARPVEKEKE